MNYKLIDMNQYNRKDHFAYFSNLAYPYVGITVNVDITDWLKIVKEKGLPFFQRISPEDIRWPDY